MKNTNDFFDSHVFCIAVHLISEKNKTKTKTKNKTKNETKQSNGILFLYQNDEHFLGTWHVLFTPLQQKEVVMWLLYFFGIPMKNAGDFFGSCIGGAFNLFKRNNIIPLYVGVLKK